MPACTWARSAGVVKAVTSLNASVVSGVAQTKGET